MKYDLVTLEQKQVVGISIRTGNSSEGVANIGETWQSFYGQKIYEGINNKVNDFGIGLYTEYESDATGVYTFMCGCEVTIINNPELDSRIISGGKYAKFSIEGDPIKDVMNTWQTIWGMDLNRKYDSDFEVYHNDSPDMSRQTIDIYISLID